MEVKQTGVIINVKNNNYIYRYEPQDNKITKREDTRRNHTFSGYNADRIWRVIITDSMVVCKSCYEVDSFGWVDRVLCYNIYTDLETVTIDDIEQLITLQEF